MAWKNLMGLTDPIKKTKACIIGIPKGKEREKRVEKLFLKIMVENSPNLRRDLDTQIHEANRSLQNFNLKQTSLRHIIKLSKIKDKENFLKIVF